MKKFPILYKSAKTGKTQQWQIIVIGDSYHTEAGQVGGKITVSEPTVCEGKNIGRANETTANEQAILEAQSKYDKKLERGYTVDIENADDGPSFYEPMLAQKYDITDCQFPAYVQRKSDGIRAIITKHGAFTRNGKRHMCVPHILKALQPVFAKSPDAIFDGELYNHELHDNFNKISSLIRKTKPTDADLIESARIVQFHCYDSPRINGLKEDASFSQRRANRILLLKDVIKEKNACIHLVVTLMVDSHDDVEKFHAKFVEEGYEGIMIRIDGPYENRRSKYLLKYKKFDTDEFIIEGIIPGVGNKTGMAGSVEMHSKSGEYFTSNIKAPHDELVYMLKNKSQFIGKPATVRYFGLTPGKQVPRFPYVIDTDRWSYE